MTNPIVQNIATRYNVAPRTIARNWNTHVDRVAKLLGLESLDDFSDEVYAQLLESYGEALGYGPGVDPKSVNPSVSLRTQWVKQMAKNFSHLSVKQVYRPEPMEDTAIVIAEVLDDVEGCDSAIVRIQNSYESMIDNLLSLAGPSYSVDSLIDYGSLAARRKAMTSRLTEAKVLLALQAERESDVDAAKVLRVLSGKNAAAVADACEQ